MLRVEPSTSQVSTIALKLVADLPAEASLPRPVPGIGAARMLKKPSEGPYVPAM